MQGIPIHEDALKAANVLQPFFDCSVITPGAQKRLAGNSFQQACMSAFLCFVLGFVMPAHLWDETKAPVFMRPRVDPKASVTFLSSESEEDDADADADAEAAEA